MNVEKLITKRAKEAFKNIYLTVKLFDVKWAIPAWVVARDWLYHHTIRKIKAL